jgi:hypothetical protein
MTRSRQNLISRRGRNTFYLSTLKNVKNVLRIQLSFSMSTVGKRKASEDAPSIKEESVADKVLSSVADTACQEEKEEELECENCDERYYESKNNDDNACVWCSTTHK